MQRQARWYGTRFLPLFGGLAALGGAMIFRRFSTVVVFEVVVSGAFGLAAWGSMVSQGRLRNVPRAARVGVMGALVAGSLFFASLIGVVGGRMVESYAEERYPYVQDTTAYVAKCIALSDGRLAIGISPYYTSSGTRYVSFSDEPLPDARPMEYSRWAAGMEESGRWESSHNYRDIDKIESPVSSSWRRPAPKLPEGLTIAPGETLLAVDWSSSRDGLMTVRAALTDKHIYLYDATHQKPLVKLPLTHPFPQYRVWIRADAAMNYFVVRYINEITRDSLAAVWNGMGGGRWRDEYVEVYDKAGKLVNSAEVDPADPVIAKYSASAKAAEARVKGSRPYQFLAGMLYGGGMSLNALPLQQWTTLRLPDGSFTYWNVYVLTGALCVNLLGAVALLGLAWVYRLRWFVAAGWGVAGLVLGPLMVIVFVGAYHWPTRVVCATCGHRRPVNEGVCPHCGVGFAMPAANGTEIIVA